MEECESRMEHTLKHACIQVAACTDRECEPTKIACKREDDNTCIANWHSVGGVYTINDTVLLIIKDKRST